MSIWTDAKGRTHVNFEKEGIRRHRAKGVTPENARQIERELIAEVEAEVAAQAAAAERAKAGLAPEVEIEDGFKRYLLDLPESARDDAEGKIDLTREWTKGRNLSEIVDANDDMVRDMKKRGYSPATINRRMAILRRIARQAHENRQWWLADVDSGLVPVKLVRPIWVHIKELPGGKNARHSALQSIEEAAALIAACENDVVKDWITISLLTGFRLSEVLKIGRDYAVDFRNKTIVIPLGKQKNRQFSTTPMLPDIKGLPSMAEAVRRCPLSVCSTTILKHVKLAAEKIGSEITPHSIRRSTGHILLKAGVDMAIISKILRHSDLKITMAHYAHVTVDMKRAALVKAFSEQQAS